MTHPIDKLSNVIRRYPNRVDTWTLATAVTDAAPTLQLNACGCAGCKRRVADIIDRVNPDRTMGAGVLAQTIWDDLNPDED